MKAHYDIDSGMIQSWYGGVTVGERPQTGKITVTKRDVVTGDVAGRFSAFRRFVRGVC